VRTSRSTSLLGGSGARGGVAAALVVTALAGWLALSETPAVANPCNITQDRSIENPTITWIDFVNQSSQTLDVYWLDYSGNAVYYFTLNPGAWQAQQTYAQQPWKVLDQDGVCRGYVIAESQRIIYTIFNDRPPPRPTQAFGAETLVTLRLLATRIPARGPLEVQVTNGNGFGVTGKLSGETVSPVAVSRKQRVKLRAKSFSVAANSKEPVALELPKALRRLLKREGELRLRLTAKVNDQARNTRAVTKRVTARLKGKPRR
jgi:VHL beta domain